MGKRFVVSWVCAVLLVAVCAFWTYTYRAEIYAAFYPLARSEELMAQLRNAHPNNSPVTVGPLPRNYKRMVETALRERLLDPASAEVEVMDADPEQGSCVTVGGMYHAWRVPVWYNAKNRFGGYVGRASEYAFIAGGVVQKFSASRDSCP